MNGQRMKDHILATWFRGFYKGFDKYFILWFPYADMAAFENPSGFRADSPLADAESALILVACI